jgi:uncharacterized protein YggT (Ycf19 family)
MTEREYYRESDADPPADRRDVYRETVVDETGAPIAGTARDVYHERIAGPDGDRVVRSEHVTVPSETTRLAVRVTRAKQVIYFIFGAINVLLALRFVLLLLGANEASSFVQLIYGLSQPFVMPFQGIFGEPKFGGSVIEWASLVAIIIYSLVGYGIARIVELIYAPARPTITRD